MTFLKCHYQIVTCELNKLSLPNCRYQIVDSKLSHYQIVITKMSLPKCHNQIVITKLSIPKCLYQIFITKLSLPKCPYQIVITKLSFPKICPSQDHKECCECTEGPVADRHRLDSLLDSHSAHN